MMLLLLLLLLLLLWWSVAELVLGGHQLVPVGVPGLTLVLGEQRRACNINIFTFKTLLRHYAKRALTPRSLNVKLGP